jgi:hypothetical protein
MDCEAASKSSADSRLVVDSKKSGRSRITNGSALLPGIDGRSRWVRRAKDVIAAHLSDLGGIDNTSAAERSIIRRASTLTVELERLETKFAKAGEASPDDLEVYQRCANSLRRLLEAICSGILQYRRPRDVTPSADEYLAGLPAEEPVPAVVEELAS